MRNSILSTSIFVLLSSTFSNAAPIAVSQSKFPKDCAYGSCSSRIQLTGTPSHAAPVSNPHNLIKIEIEITESIRNIDNSIFTPTRGTPPSQALVAHRPLSTTYLESLSRATQSIEKKVARYLSSHPVTYSSTSVSEQKTKKPCRKEWLVYLPGNVYIKTHKYVSRKPDVAIVGIVLVFLSMLVLAECIDRFVQCVRENRAQRSGRGEIYLEEKDGEVRIIGEGISVVAWEDEKSAFVHEIEV